MQVVLAASVLAVLASSLPVSTKAIPHDEWPQPIGKLDLAIIAINGSAPTRQSSLQRIGFVSDQLFSRHTPSRRQSGDPQLGEGGRGDPGMRLGGRDEDQTT